MVIRTDVNMIDQLTFTKIDNRNTTLIIVK